MNDKDVLNYNYFVQTNSLLYVTPFEHSKCLKIQSEKFIVAFVHGTLTYVTLNGVE